MESPIPTHPLDFWYRIFKLVLKHGDTSDALDCVFFYVEHAFQRQDFERIDLMLAIIEPDVPPVEMLVSILRATSRAKDRLTNWHPLLVAVSKRVKAEGLFIRMLRGL